MDSTQILGLFCLVSAAITYGFGFFVFAKNPSSPINRLFLAVMLGATYWGIGEFLIWQSNSFEETLFWLKASSLWTVVIVMTVHFILAYTGHPLSHREKIPHLILLLYLPALFFAMVEILTDNIFIVGYAPTGYYYAPAGDNLFYQVETLYFFLLMSWAVVLSILFWVRSSHEKARIQGCFLSVGFLFVLCVGSQSVFLLPLLNIHLPNLVFIGVILFSVIVSAAILKYGLFTISPETAASNLIRIMPDGLILTDTDGRVRTINSSAELLLHESRSLITGMLIGDYLPDSVFSQILEEIEGHESFSDMEVTLSHPGTVVVSISGSLVRDPDGIPAGIILIIRDISDRKAAEKALSIANEKISLLSRLTRHDISNLVTPLHGYLSLLYEEGTADPHDPQIGTCIDLVEKIITHLRFSQQYQEIGMQSPRWHSLGEMISRATAALADEQVTIEVSVSPVRIYADPLMEKVIYNLLENAVRHGETVTKVTITTDTTPVDDLIVLICDDGTGVREDEKELIFMHGYGKNSGLGLTLSREILLMTGIGITETGTYGSGACFEIFVPKTVWKPEL